MIQLRHTSEVVNTPTPTQVREARVAAGLTQAQAAELLHLGVHTRWSEYERGQHSISLAAWELFLLKVGQHPQYRVIRVSKVK